MSAKPSKFAVLGTTLALALSAGVGGCAPRVVQPVVPVAPVVPAVDYESTFVAQARMEGDFSAMYDEDVLNLGYQVCSDLTTQPEYVHNDYYDYFVTLSVQYLCPEHQQTLYQLGY